jgi:DNA-binding transcriptional ArsR family regulator
LAVPIALDLSAVAETEVRFAVSPLVEFGWAWHVLSDVGNHPGQSDWAAAVRSRIPDDLVRDMAEWSFAVRAVRATLLADPTAVPARRWADQLDWIRRMPPDDFAVSMLRPLLRQRGRSANIADARVRNSVLRLARARGPAVRRAVQFVLDEPASARSVVADLMARCWRAFFEAEWAGVSPRLSEEVAERTALCGRHGWTRGLTGLCPAIGVRPGEDRLVIDKVQNKRLRVAGRGLVLTPTVIGSVHVYVADEPGRPVVVHYPLPAPARAADSRLTLRRFLVLAHPARLEVCRAVAVEPRSAREIARLWGFSESAVTKHLSVLRSVGLVHAERAGHYVRYALDDAVVAALGADLLDVLRR